MSKKIGGLSLLVFVFELIIQATLASNPPLAIIAPTLAFTWLNHYSAPTTLLSIQVLHNNLHSKYTRLYI
jgi:hypothetical protein